MEGRHDFGGQSLCSERLTRSKGPRVGAHDLDRMRMPHEASKIARQPKSWGVLAPASTQI
jgi:hypothetical protein